MPLFQKDGQTVTLNTVEDISAATAEGYAPVTQGGTVPLVNADGRKIWVAPDKMETFAALGYAPEGVGAELSQAVQASRANEYDTGMEAVRAFGEGGLRAITGGLSDVAFRAVGVDAEDLAGRREFNETAEMAGQIVGGGAAALGALGPGALARGLSFTPAGFASRVGAGVAGRTAAALGGRAAGSILGTAAGGALEGGIYGGGQAISDAAIHDKALTADAFVSSVWSGALFGGALGGAAGAVGPALTGTGRLVKGAADRARGVVGKIDDAISSKAKRVTDAITSPGPKAATEAELAAIRRTGDQAAKEAQDLIAATGTKEAKKISLSAKLDALDTAQTELLKAEGDVAAISAYHDALSSLSEDLGKAGTKIEIPPNPTLREATEEAVSVTVDELAGKPKAGEVRTARDEVRQVVQKMDADAAPLLAEGKEIASLQKPISEIAGKDLAGLLDEVDTGARLENLVKKAESAQKKFQETFGISPTAGPGGRTVTPEILDQMFSGSQAEFAQSVKTVESYDRAMRELAEELDIVSPRATGPGRVEQLGARPIPSKPGVKPPSSEGYDLGDLLAIADVAGIDIADAPLIGQIPGLDAVLKARLVWRRLKAGSEKLSLSGRGGRVAGVAARANAVQKKLERAAVAFFDGAKPAAAKAKRLVAPTSQAILNNLSYGPTTPPREETESEAFTRIGEELSAIAENPGLLRSRVLERLDLGVPDLEEPIADAAVRKAMYLYEEYPKDPREPSLLQTAWNPGKMQRAGFAECAWAAENPVEALELLPLGRMTMRMAHAVQAVYPSLFEQMQQAILSKMAEVKDLPLRKQGQLSVFLDLAIGPAQTDSFVQGMQAGYLEKQEQPGPKPGESVRLTGLDRMSFQPTAAEGRSFT